MGDMDSGCPHAPCDTGVATGTPETPTPGEFSAFFRDIHDCEPFPWQQRLTAQVLGRGAWPKVIDLPTGTGKTAVLDTAIFALATRPTVSPRRVVFVIDRRIVVDQVCERAQRIRDRIEAGATPVLKRVRDRLRALSGGEPLGVAALRGGVPVDNEWAHRPDQPWVIVSTVDQFGSRLLFRGYGVTPGMRPIHAGLAGNDCLVILDEVHLSVPFAETLAQVAALASGRLPRRFGVVEMSATPSDTESERFTLDPVADLAGCEALRCRVEALKKAELVSVRNHDALPAAVVKIVKSIAKSRSDGNIRSVGVVVNRVRTARETRQALEEVDCTTHLITGRMRPLDRTDALQRLAPVVDPAGERSTRGLNGPESERSPSALTVVVATQAIEVGADFSFDALITECAAVDSLRQRCGRLDRRGLSFARTGVAAPVWIIGPKSVVASTKPDPIYGDSVKTTWEALERRCDEAGLIDVGPRSLMDFPDGASAPRATAPLLLDAHMDAWVQTSPEPIVQPFVEWFLHGIDRDRAASPDVSILWRRDRSAEVLRLVPPRPVEFLQVPIDAARAWLSGGEEVEVSDVAQGEDERDAASSFPHDVDGADWVRWEGFGKDPGHIGIGDVHPGDVLIVDPDRGGLKSGTWDPESNDPVSDLGDAAQIAYGRKATLRLDRHLLDTPPPPLPAEEAEADSPPATRILEWLDRWPDDAGSEVGVGTGAEAGGDERSKWLSDAVARLRSHGFDVTPVGLDGGSSADGYYILAERHARSKRPCPIVDPATMDGSDESGSLIGTGVTLDRHLDGVGERAGRVAERLGLATEFVADLRLAGRLHDVGKVDGRFQAQLVGGDPVDLQMLKEPLAKSLPGIRRVRRYPTGMRHEVASVAMVASNPDVLRSAHDADLVLHLVGTHHGWGRPLPPIVGDPAPQTLAYAFDGHCLVADSDLAQGSLALDMADRFWRLVERYGYHGLAWLEAILRLADHLQSAEEAVPS